MTKYKTKAALIEDIRVQRRRLEAVLGELNEEEQIQPGIVGDWSAKDVMAHLADWEQRFMGWYATGRRGETPEIPAPGMTWRQMDLLNQQIFEKYKDLPLDVVKGTFTASYQQILALIESLPEEELFDGSCYGWLNGEVMAGWAAANTSNHYYWAKTQIQKALSRRG